MSVEEIDLASLNLGFYLASWGMYRGSSFLLQYDYKIHAEAISIILKYKCLRAITLDNLDDKKTTKIFELIDELKEHYKPYREKIKKSEEEPQKDISDTLVTKILLGTLGCIPAYDEYFIKGIRTKGLKFSNLNKKTLRL